MNELGPHNVGLLQRKSHQCCWIVGKGADGLALYCGHTKSRYGSDWCDGHAIRGYTFWPPRFPLANKSGRADKATLADVFASEPPPADALSDFERGEAA